MDDSELKTHFLDLLRRHRTGSLGTLSEQGWPYVSMTPFAIDGRHKKLVIHVSALGAHTRYLLRRPQASFMICAPEKEGEAVHALARVTLQVQAHVLPRSTDIWCAARDAYLGRFPDTAFMMAFTDFHLFHLEILRVRQVSGFGAAKTLNEADATRWLADC